jgi:hypothetical protein
VIVQRAVWTREYERDGIKQRVTEVSVEFGRLIVPNAN